MAISSTMGPFLRGMAMQKGLLPTPGCLEPHMGMQLSVLVQLMPMNPARAACHA